MTDAALRTSGTAAVPVVTSPTLDNAHALVIAIANYQNVNRLPPTVLSDAKGVRDVLLDPDCCAYPRENVTLLVDGQATGTAIRGAFADLARRTDEGSTVLLYASAHGGRVSSGPRAGDYLLPVDAVCASAEDLARTAISGDDLSQALRAVRARKLLVLLDCCHAGGIGQPKDPAAPEITPLPESYYDVLDRGLGRAILASSRSSELSWIKPGASHSLFTQHLLDGLRGSAVGAGGVIRVTDLFDYVAPRVTHDQPNQHPVFKAEYEENFAVALYRGGKAPQPAPPPPPSDGFQYDVYVSYSDQDPADRAWVRQKLVPRLEADGLRVIWDWAREWRFGRPKIDNIADAVEHSRYTVVVLSPAYLASAWDMYESKVAQSLGIEVRQARFVPVMRQLCRPGLDIRMRDMLDVTVDDEFEMAAARLVYLLRLPPAA